MEKETIKSYLDVSAKLHELHWGVSKERYSTVAKELYGMTEVDIDKYYGLFQSLPNLPHNMLCNDENMEMLCTSIEIAEKARNFSVPHAFVHTDDKKVKYLYRKDDELHELCVNLHDSFDIGVLSTILSDDSVDVLNVVDYITTIESYGKTNKTDCYDGDIVFTYADPTDKMFCDYYHCKDRGVFVITKKGWRKLFYTPHRGYLDNDGEPDIQDETHYSDYMIEQSGTKFRVVGNIYKDSSVLKDCE